MVVLIEEALGRAAGRILILNILFCPRKNATVFLVCVAQIFQDRAMVVKS
jgi:hypothetical protein